MHQRVDRLEGEDEREADREDPVSAGSPAPAPRDWLGVFFGAALGLVEVLWVLGFVVLVWWLI